MHPMQTREHWENVYTTRPTNSVSWFQDHAHLSLRLIESTGVSTKGAIIDVGGGASSLVDDLLARGYADLTVLDLSKVALNEARERLGARAEAVQWITSDITKTVLPVQAYDIWHDRAVFHFLVTAEDRRAYVQTLLRSLRPHSHVIVATFAEDGPTSCSGLAVQRYSPAELAAVLGPHLSLEHHEKEVHHTPGGTEQNFNYCYFRVK